MKGERSMAGYTKLFTTLLDSTVWVLESKETRLVWITMLLKKNQQQVVECSVPGLAQAAGVELAECEAALKRLMEPDPYSKTREHEGRRIKEVEGGWLVLNGAAYRDRMTADDRREYKRMKQREYRSKNTGLPLPGETAAVRAMDRGDEAGAQRIQHEALPKGAQ